MGFDISLSPSKLNKFNECPRCFFDECNKKIAYPGIMATLMGGVDRVIKGHYDACRAAGILPPELVGKVPAHTTLYGNVETMKKFRHWKSNPHKTTIHTKSGVVSLIMAYDDVLTGPDGISNLDAKSKGDVPKDDGSKYYLTQLDSYYLSGLLNGWTMSGIGYLAYYYPKGYRDGHIHMGCEVFGLKCDKDRVLDLIERAAACLAGGQPDHSPTCEICTFSQIRVDAALASIAQPAIQQASASV